MEGWDSDSRHDPDNGDYHQEFEKCHSVVLLEGIHLSFPNWVYCPCLRAFHRRYGLHSHWPNNRPGTLGVEVVKLYCEPTGHFPHNPEPLKEHLGDICDLVIKENADFGIVVDPDVDRLAFISNDGEMFGEEYTLVACADYVLGKTKGNTVSNLSSSRALRDITQKHGGTYEAAAVGEVNVVTKMKANKAIIGGEGNGGIIYPESHYGRDSLVGSALFLMLMAEKGGTVKELRDSYPSYFMSKKKIQLTPELDVDGILKAMADKYQKEDISTIDGVKVDFAENWVHLRKSNTEPIIRIYTEAKSQSDADSLADRIIGEIKEVAGI